MKTMENMRPLINKQEMRDLSIEDIIRMFRSWDPDIQNRGATFLYYYMEGYVKSVITNYFPSYKEKYMDDLFHEGMKGVFDGAAKYDPAIAKPTTFFKRYIFSEISQYVTKQIHESTPHFQKYNRIIKKAEQEFVRFGKTDYTDTDLAIATGINLETIKNTRKVSRKMISHIESTDVDFYSTSAQIEGPLESLINNEVSNILWECLDKLPELERDVLVGFYVENHSMNEVAQKLDVPIHIIKKAREHSLKQLKTTISVKYNGEERQEILLEHDEIELNDSRASNEIFALYMEAEELD